MKSNEYKYNRVNRALDMCKSLRLLIEIKPHEELPSFLKKFDKYLMCDVKFGSVAHTCVEGSDELFGLLMGLYFTYKYNLPDTMVCTNEEYKNLFKIKNK